MKANIGCGHKILEGYVNIDKYPFDSTVLQGDLESSLPLENLSVDYILLDNVIEHIFDIPKALSEIARVLSPGGTCKIITPHFSSATSWRDPTHIHHLSYFSFDYLNSPHRSNYFGTPPLQIHSAHLSFPGGVLGLIGRMIFKASPRRWENSYCFVFRASTLNITLIRSA